MRDYERESERHIDREREKVRETLREENDRVTEGESEEGWGDRQSEIY